MDNKGVLGRRLVTAALLFVLLSEWMRPLAEMSEVTGIYLVEPLLFTLAALMATDVLRLPLFLSWVIKLLIVLSMPATVYDHTSLIDAGWWKKLFGILLQDGGAVLQLRWGAVSGELRTLLFVLSWAVVATVLFSAVQYKRFMLWFTAATVVYLLALSGYLGIDTFAALLRAAAAGLLLHALYVPSVLRRIYEVSEGKLRVRTVRWPVSILFLVALAVGSGYVLAGQGESVAPRPLPAWKSIQALSKLGGEQAQRMAATGYGLDDSRLGGSLKPDDTPAFLAVTDGSVRYWRGEAKTLYDGKGWQARANDVFRYEQGSTLPDLMAAASPDADGAAGREAEEHELLVLFMDEEWLARLHAEGVLDRAGGKVTRLSKARKPMPVFAGGGVKRVERVSLSSGLTDDGVITVDRLEGSYWMSEHKEAVTGYQAVTYGEMQSGGLGASESLAPQQLDASLQLPEDLPERVRLLAKRITEPYPTVLEKALAVERFLRSRYTYSLNPPPAAAEDGDFVDQFLFVQREGYCDYFSTAMAVLLRSVDIPARWVKGFAQGEAIAAAPDGLIADRVAAVESETGLRVGGERVYSLVRNSDAHSWVEVFIPGRGWRTFEPTPGFNGRPLEAALEVDPFEAEAIPAMGEISNEALSHEGWLQQLGSQARVLWTDGKRFMRTVPSEVWERRREAAVLAGLFFVMAVLWLILRSERACISVRLFLYSCGIGGVGADARLLERVVAFGLFGDGAPLSGETMREAAVRRFGHADPFAAAADYERLAFGPPRHARFPGKRMRKVWRAVLDSRKLGRI